jgi:hypothetical protein
MAVFHGHFYFQLLATHSNLNRLQNVPVVPFSEVASLEKRTFNVKVTGLARLFAQGPC